MSVTYGQLNTFAYENLNAFTYQQIVDGDIFPKYYCTSSVNVISNLDSTYLLRKYSSSDIVSASLLSATVVKVYIKQATISSNTIISSNPVNIVISYKSALVLSQNALNSNGFLCEITKSANIISVSSLNAISVKVYLLSANIDSQSLLETNPVKQIYTDYSIESVSKLLTPPLSYNDLSFLNYEYLNTKQYWQIQERVKSIISVTSHIECNSSFNSFGTLKTEVRFSQVRPINSTSLFKSRQELNILNLYADSIINISSMFLAVTKGDIRTPAYDININVNSSFSSNNIYFRHFMKYYGASAVINKKYSVEVVMYND